MRLLLAALLLVVGCIHTPTNLTKGPGAAFAHPKVHLVSWNGAVGDWSPWRAVLPDLFARCAEYGVGAPASFDFASAEPVLSGTILDFDLVDEINREIGAGVLPEPTAEDVYMVFLPAGSTTTYLELGGFSGYHSGAALGETPYAFAAITNTWRGYDVVGTHELVEVATDPYGSAWRDWSSGDEAADICEYGLLDTLDGMQVAQVWSQKAGACE